MKKIFTDKYDIEGNELLRVVRTYLFHNLIPVGNLQRGPGVRCLAVLTILHYFGKPLFYLFMKHESTIRRLYHFLKRVAGRS